MSFKIVKLANWKLDSKLPNFILCFYNEDIVSKCVKRAHCIR